MAWSVIETFSSLKGLLKQIEAAICWENLLSRVADRPKDQAVAVDIDGITVLGKGVGADDFWSFVPEFLSPSRNSNVKEYHRHLPGSNKFVTTLPGKAKIAQFHCAPTVVDINAERACLSPSG